MSGVQVGQQVGAGNRFELLQELGEGGMGQVFLARQEHLDRLVALKVLKPEVAADRTFAKRFQREARAAAQFEHSNVVKVYEAGEDAASGTNYIALEYLSGGSMEDRVVETGRMQEVEVLEAALGIATALAFASEKGIVHRDVKPDNILFDAQGNAKLADLGLAKLLVSDKTQTHLTESGTVVGTPYYMAPEQAMGEPLDTRADVYALGLCMWRCLTGELPFSDGDSSTVRVLTRRLREEPADVRDFAPEISAPTADLVAWATTLDVKERCTAAELVETLADALDRLGSRRTAARRRNLGSSSRARTTPTVASPGAADVDIQAETMAMPMPARARPPAPPAPSGGPETATLRRNLLLAIVLLLLLAVIELLVLLLHG